MGLKYFLYLDTLPDLVLWDQPHSIRLWYNLNYDKCNSSESHSLHSNSFVIYSCQSLSDLFFDITLGCANHPKQKSTSRSKCPLSHDILIELLPFQQAGFIINRSTGWHRDRSFFCRHTSPRRTFYYLSKEAQGHLEAISGRDSGAMQQSERHNLEVKLCYS